MLPSLLQSSSWEDQWQAILAQNISYQGRRQKEKMRIALVSGIPLTDMTRRTTEWLRLEAEMKILSEADCSMGFGKQ